MERLRFVCRFLAFVSSVIFGSAVLFAQAIGVPVINQLVPDTAAPGSGSFTLTVIGAGFGSNTEVYWNGSLRPTTVLSNTAAQIQVSAADIAHPGTASITAGNLRAGEEFSNVVYFPIRNSALGLGFLPTTFDLAPYSGAVAVGDFNNDGKVDFAAASGMNIEVFLGNGDGTFKSPVVITFGGYPTAMAAGDFNGDGNPDLAIIHTGHETDVVSVLLGKGDGTFIVKKVSSVRHALGLLSVGDFDGDGNLDLYIPLPYFCCEIVASIWHGNGDGTFSPSSSGRPLRAVGYPALGDFDGDGILDVAVAGYDPHLTQGFVDVFLSSGSGKRVPYKVNFAGDSVTAVDVNGDGNLDLVTNGVSVLLGNGDGTFRSAGGISVNQAQLSLNVGDFNGDGFPDIAAGLNVLLGTGDGKFQKPMTFAGLESGDPYPSIAMGDFNGDGKLDLVGVNDLSGEFSVFMQVRVYLTPINLVFGSYNIGTTSPPQAAHLRNFSPTNPLNISNIGFSGTNAADFGQTNTCKSPIPPDKGCQIQATFTPSIVGNEVASLDVTYTNGGSNPDTLRMPLSGTGTDQTYLVTLTPSSLTFPLQLVGTASAPQFATLTNTGNQPVTISSILATAPFSETNNCPGSLPAGQNCTITVVFTPTDKGIVNGTLKVSDNAEGSPQQVALSGTGTAVMISPTGINFGNEKVGSTSAPVPVTLSNLGTSSLSIKQIQITGAEQKDFKETNTCGSSVPAQGHCTITVTFTPTAKGKRSAALSISDDDPTSPQSVPLSGTGT